MNKLRARTVFADQRLTVTAVESLAFQAGGAGHGRFLTVHLEPIAIIVRQQDRTYALDMGAQSLDLDSLNLPADVDLK